MNPVEVWGELARAEHGPSGYSVRRLPGERDVRLAVRYPGAVHVLLLGFPAPLFDDPIEVPESAGFTVATAALPGEPGFMQIEVGLRSQQFAELFGALVQDLIDKTLPASDDSAALSALVTRLQEWQKFLERLRPEGLTREEQIGLYGELWVLHELVAPASGNAHAIRFWNGPNGANQDFRFDRVALEVKASTALEPQNIRITNERQLDSTGIEHLFLMQLSLSRDAGGGESLQQMVQSVRELALAGGVAAEFDEALVSSGYFEGQLRDYSEFGYTMLRRRVYAVTDGFPRITQATISEGVGDVHYSISVGTCQPFLSDEATLRDRIREQVQ